MVTHMVKWQHSLTSAKTRSAMTDAPKDTSMKYEPIQPRHLSHDLRGPLNSILGFTELLLDGIEGPLNEIQMEDIAAIRQSAKDLLELINQMVDFSKLEANQLRLRFGPEALDEIISQLVADSTVTNLKLTSEIPAEIPLVEVDRPRVEQLFNHLITFLQAHGASRIEIQILSESQAVITRVTAPGVSLTAPQQAELFEATAAVDSAGRSKLTTGGLSLPLAAKLAASQEGQLYAVSGSTTGLTFVLSLPVLGTQ
jgi:signal transduction histidine kinase